jgi:PAS domain S-box-containing protein
MGDGREPDGERGELQRLRRENAELKAALAGRRDSEAACREQAERALRKSEENYRDLVENARAIVLRWDTKGNVTFWNEYAERLFGFSKQELIGRNVVGTIVPAMDLSGRNLERMVAEMCDNPDRFQNNENENITRDGRRVWVRWNNRAIRDEAGRLTGILSVGIDITKRKRAEDALRESEKLFRGWFDLPLIGVAVLSPEGRWLRVNDRLCADLGYSREELLAATWMDVTAPGEIEADLAAYRKSFLERPQTLDQFEKRFRRKDGSLITASVSARAVYRADGGIDYLVAVIQDITDRKRLEARLLQAQKMETVGRLAGGVAHDFNNLLTVITGNAEVALKEVTAGQPLFEELAEIQRAAGHAAELTGKLLAFSHRQIVEPKVVDLNRLLPEMEKMLRRLIGENIELSTVLAPNLSPVRIDPVQIEQVLANLAVNARDAMPGGGRLRIETAEAVLGERDCRGHPDATPGGYVVISVIDTGTGMDEEVLSHLFEPFFTTKPPDRGTGLGMSTCYGIVRQHGGDIRVDSRPGQGTTVRVYLPALARAAARPAAAAAAAREPDTPARGTETVLVVEDEEGIRHMVPRALEPFGYRVLAAADGPEALALAGAHDGPIHLLVTDMVMPAMNGRELAERLVEARPGLKVIYMSGYTDDALMRQGAIPPGQAFIHKPFTLASFFRKIRETLDG